MGLKEFLGFGANNGPQPDSYAFTAVRPEAGDTHSIEELQNVRVSDEISALESRRQFLKNKTNFDDFDKAEMQTIETKLGILKDSMLQKS